MKRFLLTAIALFCVSLASPAKALTRIEIDDTTATTSVPTITVPSGHSVVLSMDNGRLIQALWIDDPSILGVATDRPLCSDGSTAQNCGSATTVRLTQLSGALNLPGSSFSQGNGLATVMSLITTDSTGHDRQVYQFTVNTIAGRSDVSHVAITPTVAVSPQVTGPSVQSFRRADSLDINAVRSGRDVVLSSGRANTTSPEWQNLVNFLDLVEKDTDINDAARASRVNMTLLAELERLGFSSTPVSEI